MFDRKDVFMGRFNLDPKSTWSRRMTARFIRLLPIESQL